MRLLPVIGFCLLSAVTGYLLGDILAVHSSLSDDMLTITSSSGASIPTIELTETRDVSIVGTITGDVRLFAAGTQILPDASGAIVIPAEPFLTRIIEVGVPEGMRFVASRRGSKYYPVDSAQGNNLSVTNRIYFRSKEEAEAAGYGAGK